MWEEIRQVIFDATSATGFKPGFLANVIAETYGLIFGAVISVFIAYMLDRGRESNRQADHRVRAVTRWIRNHSDMLLRIRKIGAESGEERRQAERRESVLASIQYAEGIKDDYSEALDAPKISVAFLAYTQALQVLAEEVSENQIHAANVCDAAKAAFDCLTGLVDTTAPHALRKAFTHRLQDIDRLSRLDFAGEER